MSVGHYTITGWMKVEDAVGFDRKEPFEHHCTSREMVRTQYKKYCFESEDPRLIKVVYYYADRVYEITRDVRFPELNRLIREYKNS